MSDWLDSIKIASPCPADWDQMTGDDTCRYCSSCRLNVYNISEMSRDEAENMILEKEAVNDRLCLQFLRRKDGTIITQDCPVGVLRFRRGIVKAIGAMAACLTLVFGFFGVARATSNGTLDKLVHRKPTLSKMFHWINPECSTCLANTKGIRGRMMGMVAPPTPPKPTPQKPGPQANAK